MNILESRRRTLGKGVYKKTVEGNPAIAQGSLARRYPGITMQGWTEQDSTTGVQLINPTLEEATNEGVTFTKNDDGTYRVKGIAGDIGASVKIASVTLPAGTYTLSSIGNVGTGGGTWNSRCRALKEDEFGLVGDAIIPPLTQTLEQPGASGIYIQVNKGVTIDATVKPMLNEGTTAKPYEPYTGNAPSPSPEYPQEIKNAGKYDEGTQKWEFEITIANEQTDPDKNQTVTLTSDRPLTKWDKLEKRNGVWGWVYKSAEIVLDGSEEEAWELSQTDNYNQFYIRVDTLEHSNAEKNVYCEKFRSALIGDRETKKEIIYTVRAIIGAAIAVSTELATEVDAWKTWLQSNPITVLYKSTEETFVPLSESEQEQMNTLHTFRPTTVLSNDAGCNMELTYKTKKSLEVTT